MCVPDMVIVIYSSLKRYLQKSSTSPQSSPSHQVTPATSSKPGITLAVDVDSVSVQSVRISIIESLRGGQLGSSRVSVTKIVSARAVNTVGVGLLMKDSSGLILSVASRRDSGKFGEEDGAVGDVAG